MLEAFCDNLKVKDEDFILMTGNFIRFLRKCKNYNKDFDLNLFLDKLMKYIKKKGGGDFMYSNI